MNKWKKILLLLVGRDEWAQEIHGNKNKLAIESIKATRKLQQVNRALPSVKIVYHKDTAYFMAKGMGSLK